MKDKGFPNCNAINILLIVFACPMMSVNCYAETDREAISNVPTVPDMAAMGVVEDVEKLLDASKLEEGRAMLDRHLQKYPDDLEGRLQLVRYQMKKNYVVDGSIVGHHYDKELAQKLITLLDKIIKDEPFYYKAYTLKGYIHAVQGDVGNATVALQKAENAPVKPFWLDHNKALLYIQQKRHAEAIKLLKPITNERPASSNKAEYNRYVSAWSLWRRLGESNAWYDSNELVRTGYVKRVLPEKLLDYVSTYKGSKPIFVHVGSEDKFCPFCIDNNKVMEKLVSRFKTKLHFVNVNSEPWSNIFHYPQLDKLKLKGMPSNYIFMNGKIISVNVSAMKVDEGAKFIYRALYEISRNNFDRYRNVSDIASSMLLSYGVENKVLSYKSKAGYKAIAITIDDSGKWTTYSISNKPSKTIATDDAINGCNNERIKQNINKPCVLYAEGDNYLFNDAPKELLTVLKRDFINAEDKIKYALDSELKEIFELYKSISKPYNSLAIVTHSSGIWKMGYSSQASTQVDANQIAINKCSVVREKMGFPDQCKLYAVGDTVVHGKSSVEISKITASVK